MSDEQIHEDAQLAAAVHEAEAALNIALRCASEHGLDAEAYTTDASLLGRGRCVMVRVAVRRRL